MIDAQKTTALKYAIFFFGLVVLIVLIDIDYAKEHFGTVSNCNSLEATAFSWISNGGNQSRLGLQLKSPTEPLVYEGSYNDEVYIPFRRYNRVYSIQMEGTTNNMFGNWVILPDNNVHIRKGADHTSDFSLFILELILANPNRTNQDQGIICMNDQFVVLSADLPGHYICLPANGGDMVVKNDGCKAIFRFRNKYTNARTHTNQNGPMDTADVELVYLSPGGSTNGRKVEFLKGKTIIGTGLASPSQHVYIVLNHVSK
jgi:hypothetical protein